MGEGVDCRNINSAKPQISSTEKKKLTRHWISTEKVDLKYGFRMRQV